MRIDMGEVSRLGRRLKAFRERAGLTQDELAARSGVSRTVIAGLETGQRSGVLLDSAIKIARALGVSIDHLAGTWENELVATLA
jgi:transcriptional regulator with XRE-family HTH domain